MAIITTFTDNQPVVQLDSNMVGVIENYVSFAATSVSAADVVEVLDMPEGFFCSGDVYNRVVTAEGAACTATIGDGDDPNGYCASANFNAAAGVTLKALEASDALGATGKYYSSADTIDATMGHDTDTAIIYFAALGWWPARMAS